MSNLNHMKSAYNKFIDFVISFVVMVFKKRTFIIWTDGKKYLQRTYIKKKGIFPEIFLHKFYASDSDRHLHNHPWEWARSLILKGSYKEEKSYGIDTLIACHSPGDFNSISKFDYHRVTLCDDQPVVTLFIAGKRTQGWGFWVDDKHVPWQEYVVQHNNYVTDLDGNITVLPE